MMGLGYSPFQSFWPLFLHHTLLSGTGFSVYPHAFTAPWIEVITVAGEALGMPELQHLGVMVRTPAGGGFLTRYGPDFFQIVHLRAGFRPGVPWGVGLDLRLVEVEGETPSYSGSLVISGEFPVNRGVFFWALETDGVEAQAWGTFWVTEGPGRLALDGEWREGEFLGSVAFLLALHERVDMGVAFHSSRATGFLVRIVPGEGLLLSIQSKTHPDLPLSTGIGLSFMPDV